MGCQQHHKVPQALRGGRIHEFTPRETYAIVDDQRGPYLGQVVRLTLWSALESLGETHALASIANTPAPSPHSQRARAHRVPTLPREINAQQLDAF